MILHNDQDAFRVPLETIHNETGYRNKDNSNYLSYEHNKTNVNNINNKNYLRY